MRFESVEAFESSVSPQEYEEWLWSLEFDPPIADRLDLLLSLIEWRLTYMMAKKEDMVAFAKHRVRWDSEQPQEEPRIIYYESREDDDEDSESDDSDESSPDTGNISDLVMIREAHDSLRAGLGLSDQQPIMPLIPRPNAVPVPAHLFASMTRKVEETEE